MNTGGGAFSPEEVAYLRTLPAVAEATPNRITYAERFKCECLRRYLAGESPVELFREAGLDPALVGYKRIERSFARWRANHALQVQVGAQGEMAEGNGRQSVREALGQDGPAAVRRGRGLERGHGRGSGFAHGVVKQKVTPPPLLLGVRHGRMFATC